MMPLELLLSCFSYLPHKDLGNCAVVNSHWRANLLFKSALSEQHAAWQRGVALNRMRFHSISAKGGFNELALDEEFLVYRKNTSVQDKKII
jgi:hypothetical protein